MKPENKNKIEKMYLIGKKVGEIIEKLKEEIKVNVSGKDISKIAEKLMKEKNIFSSSLGYRGFPDNICISLNNTVTHGIPNEIKFKDGDIVSLDVCCYLLDEKKNKYHADCATTVLIDNEKKYIEKKKLIKTTEKTLKQAINQIIPNKTTTQEIGNIIEKYAMGKNYFTIKEFGGHGIGNLLHEKPFIPNFKTNYEGEIIKEGMFICIEPLLQEKDDIIEISDDGWGVISKKGNLSAHFEHTLHITKKEAVIITNHK